MKYEKAVAELIEFSNEDVIQTSSECTTTGHIKAGCRDRAANQNKVKNS